MRTPTLQLHIFSLASKLFFGLCIGVSAQHSEAADSTSPSAAFAQIGAAESTFGATVGLNWFWAQPIKMGRLNLRGYWEASLSEWSYPTESERRTAGLVQLGLIPVLRWQADGGASPWFAEAGIGATLTTAVYQTERKRFSTRFNFGDHLAVGRSFGPARAHELSVRLEHFSNAGIKQPNPGENFFQMRYLFKLK